MQVQEIMSRDPACCAPVATIADAARLMTEHDCGEIPVLDAERKPLGVITDRDIACRAVENGKQPGTRVQEVMSSPPVTVPLDASVDECCRIMESSQIRRVPVVDGQGGCCGVVAQADLARHGQEHLATQLVRSVSQPTA